MSRAIANLLARRIVTRVGFAIALLILAGLLCFHAGKAQAGPAVAGAAQPPAAARAYRADLVRTAHAVWGLGAPVAVFAAQIHQESGWKPNAVSYVGAAGLAQFMPGTSQWIATIDSALVANQPFNPAWAMRALMRYDLWLYERTPARYSAYDRMWVALRSYNGGLGHWQAEAKLATNQTREAIDAACGRAKRAAVHCAENLGYPRRILVALQPSYLTWGPGL